MSKGIGVIYNVIAGQNGGKSGFFINEVEASRRWNFIYDRRGEYLGPRSFRLSKACAARTTVFYNIKNFRANLMNFENSNIGVEEAPTVIKAYTADDLNDLLTGVFHQGNRMYLLWQTCESVPVYVQSLTHYSIILADTGEDLDLLKRKRPRYYRALLKGRRQGFPVVVRHQKPNF